MLKIAEEKRDGFPTRLRAKSGAFCRWSSLVFARGNPCGELPYGKTTVPQRLEILASPILNPLFWRRLYREVIMGHPADCFPRLSRITSLVFLLDPGAKLVWPHPRIEPAPDFGTVLAHWILRLRNPGLAVRELPGLGCQTSAETDLEFQRELQWRSMMFETYGDKWPKSLSVMPRGSQVSDHPESNTLRGFDVTAPRVLGREDLLAQLRLVAQLARQNSRHHSEVPSGPGPSTHSVARTTQIH